MPIERFPVGRRYTRRIRVQIRGAALETDEGAAVLAETLRSMATTSTARRRIAVARCWAAAVLERVGLPLDPAAPIYSDRHWLKGNERRTLEWYAIEILDAAAWIERFRERGDTDFALTRALDLGGLVAEVGVIKAMADTARTGGTKPKEGKQELHQNWREKAAEIWARRPSRSVRRVSSLIDPDHWETVRKQIADLKPKKST
jgi:hypothetical protein